MTGRLEGRTAVVTGGASGIGEGTVRLFVEEGANVVVADLQDEAGAALEPEEARALATAALAASRFGVNLSEWEEDTLVHLSDRDNDGHVDADEFVATMKDFKQSASRIVFGGPKARRSGGVSEALNWTPGPITAFELNLSDREVKKWLRSPLAAASFGL